MKRKVTKAIFPVAGLGTRFLPATKSIPKEIMTLVDRPLIQYAIDEARAAGIKEFLFVTSRGKSALEDYFDHAPELESALRRAGKTDLLEILKDTNMDSGAIAYVRQNRAMGLGHAVWCARRLIGNEPFAVLLPDDVIAAEKPCLQQMIEAYEQTGGNMVAAMEVAPAKTASYGVLDVSEDMGAIVRARGLVTSSAWGEPHLLPITRGEGIDGMLDLIFQASAPPDMAPLGPFMAVEAILPIAHGHPYKGIRVRSGYNAVSLKTLPGFAEVAAPKEDCAKCLGRYFQAKGAAAPAGHRAPGGWTCSTCAASAPICAPTPSNTSCACRWTTSAPNAPET